MIPLSPLFEKHFDAFVRTQARALFLYGKDERETLSLRRAQRELFASMDQQTKQRLDVEIWPGSVHSLLEVARQREIIQRTVTWIVDLYGMRQHSRTEAGFVVPEQTAMRV